VSKRGARAAALVAHEHERTWRACLATSALVGLGQIAFALIDLRVYPDRLLSGLRLGHAALCAVLVALLLVYRRNVTPRAWKVAFLLIGLPFLPIFWIAELRMAALGVPWTPFIGHKLVMIGIALLAPSVWLGGFLIGGVALEAVLLWLSFVSRVRLAVGWEPWVTLIYAAVAVALLAYRGHSLRLEHEFLRARAEAESLERFARLFLAVRDQVNTPLQTIELATVLLELRCPDGGEESLQRIQHSVNRLRELMRLLSGFDNLMQWREEDASLDAQALLQQLRQELIEEARRMGLEGRA
jgi:hypothetical protein